ncbi:hypothetical protein HDU82_008071 [Entophlyctis luteolus]|nr:hypothetical protein HDU82_008071 [Entophlyctis luteolus]KAJ3388113.1 hypothetical protein HDU84_000273 [Entophlyctis sp. JEL0112]
MAPARRSASPHTRPFAVPILLLSTFLLLRVPVCVRAQDPVVVTSRLSPFANSLNLNCTHSGPGYVDDYGYLLITPSLLTATSANNNTNTSQLTFTVQSSVDLIVSKVSFTQDDINTRASTLIITPQANLLTTINSTVTKNIVLLLNDQYGSSITCNLPIVVQYNFAPYLNPASSLTITTTSNQPSLLSSKILQIYERHGLSSWNLNLTNVGTDFSQGGRGLLEYFKGGSWLPLPLNQPIPYEWIDIKALRYNPNGFVGTVNLVLQVVTARGFTLTPWIDSSTQQQTLQATVAVTCTSPTNSTVVATIPNPPDYGLSCYTSYPSVFTPSLQTPIGPYCMNFSTVAGVSVTATVTDFLSASLTLTTSVNAIVYFGTSIAPTSDYIPSGMSLLKFAGFLDYSAFYIYVTPSTASIVVNSLTFITPELAYDVAQAGITAASITGVTFDPVAKTSSQFFPSGVNLAGPPQITTALSTSNVGMFFFCVSSSSTTNGTTDRNVPYGTVTYIASWGTRQFVFPTSKHGYLLASVNANIDLRVSIMNSCATTWVPGGAGKFDCFTLSYSTTSATTVQATIILQYTWNLPIAADYNAVDANNIEWA